MDGDGELRLSLMATLAQEESRKTSERVRAGQKISRDKGVLYGNGNILGYDRVGSTYVINQEQAETVRMIYDLYLKGYGFTKIAHELTKLKRRDASGTIKWDCTKVSRTLHNATYMGYKCYLKSHRDNYLDQKTITNRDESTYMYVKGDFEPIISEDIWYRCKEIRESKRAERGLKAGKRIVTGNRPSNDIWVKKTVCKCGCHFRRDKWHRNKNGFTYGYKCYRVLNNGSRSSRIKDGIDDLDGFCDMGTIAGWKFEMMAYYIFNKLTLNKEGMIDSVYSKYKKINPSGEKDDATIIRQLESSIQRENSKLENLTAMRMEGELSKEEYLEYKNKLLTNITRLQQEIDSVRSQSICRDQVVCRGLSKQEMQELLKSELDFSKPNIKEGLIDTIVSKVLAHSALEFDWYLNLFPHADESEYNEVATFIISYEEAHSYREMRNEMLRRNQYQELTVRIFV